MTLQLPVSSAELTRAEQKILDFINTNPDTFLFSSIGQLAQQLELSDATLSRFARHVGCQDFKELKNLVLEQSASGPAVKLAGALQEGESFSLSAWMNRQQLYLQKTAEQLDPAEFERAVQALIQARQVYIHGKNASGSLAQLLFFRLRRLGIAVSLLPSSGSELLEGLHLARQGDLVILFSLSKLSREGRVILDYAKTAGYTTLSFVSRTCLPPEESAQINLLPRHREGIPLDGRSLHGAGRIGGCPCLPHRPSGRAVAGKPAASEKRIRRQFGINRSFLHKAAAPTFF